MEFATLYSGSSGNAIFVQGGKSRIIVDAGMSAKKTVEALDTIKQDINNIDAICISHEHSDHIKGIEVLARRYNIPVYASPKTWDNLPFKNKISPNLCKVYKHDMMLGEININFFKTSHDATQPVGFILKHQSKSLGIATDTGVLTPGLMRSLKNANALVFEANYNQQMLKESSYPYFLKNRILSKRGHLSNKQAGQALAKIGQNCQQIILSHLSASNNLPEVALKEVQDNIAQQGVKLKAKISVAPRYEPHPLINLI